MQKGGNSNKGQQYSLPPEAQPFVPSASYTNLTPHASEFKPSGSSNLTPTASEFKPSSGAQVYRRSAQKYTNTVYADGLNQSAAYDEINPAYNDLYNIHDKITDAPKLVPRSCRPIPSKRTYMNSVMLPEDLRTYYTHLTKLSLAELPPDHPRINEVPREFHSVMPLDDPNKKFGKAGTSGYPTALYKVVSFADGYLYCLRRVDNVRRGIRETCTKALRKWSEIRHANIVPLRNAFERKGALFFLYDYYPGAETLHEYILRRGTGNLLKENEIWSIALQILNAIRHVHRKKMACRCINPARIIICGRRRARISGVGLMDVLESESKLPLIDQQQEDLSNLGRVVLVLSCMSMEAYQDVQGTLEFISSNFSMELAQFATILLTRPCKIGEVVSFCAERLADHASEFYEHADAVEEQLNNQFESERLFRLMVKLGLVNERPEYGDAWSETGDRYIIKLFRDYVFHQTDDEGHPWLDIGHIIDSLNKLEMGTDEKLLLSSRDERATLVVTFADVRRCLEHTFHEILPLHIRHNLKAGLFHA